MQTTPNNAANDAAIQYQHAGENLALLVMLQFEVRAGKQRAVMNLARSIDWQLVIDEVGSAVRKLDTIKNRRKRGT